MLVDNMFRPLLGVWAALLLTWTVGCDRMVPKPAESQSSESQSFAATSGTQAPSAEVEEPTSADPDTDATTAVNLLASPDSRIVSPSLDSEREMFNRSFATIQPIEADSPAALINHLREVDIALQDLVVAGSSNFLDEQTFTEGGLRLGRMKRSTGKQLAESPQASAEERKAGVLAQLVALSHMSGLKDIESAKELQKFAGEMANSGDADLAHQSRVVLLGFELQSLQNGIHSDTDRLLTQVEMLVQRPQDRSFPEFMVLQQARQVLVQMGFTEAAETVRQTIVDQYRTATDPQLRGEAWLIETQASQAYQNFLVAFRALGTNEFDPAAALAAVRGLYEAFPSVQTLEQIATAVSNIEYSGQIGLSQDIVAFAQPALANHADADLANIDKLLSDHSKRMSLLNNTLQLSGLVGFDGAELDLQQYAGKVVLVDFWASWCVRCMNEIPAIRAAHQEFASQGFAVLSVNMDEKIDKARSFVEQQKFPWRSFYSDNPQLLGFSAPFARQLGINAIPFMILVGQDGKVSALHVRGDRLRPAILELMKATAQ